MKVLKYCLIIIIATALSGCTQSDGYIGNWFGSWHLEQMLINGNIDETYENYRQEGENQVMINFQGKIFNIAYVGGSEIYGSWSYAGQVLTLIASDKAGSGNQSPMFDPYPIVMHFPKGVYELEITVTHIYESTMQWQFIDSEGNLITYNFRKYP